MPAIEVSGLTYTYPGAPAPALQGVTFQVEPGQLLGVVGANGAGKSSLCLALAGLIPALFHGQMQGTVKVCGLDTRLCTPGQLAGKIGLVLQNPANQLSGMRYTVYEEAAFGLENLGIPRSEMPARIERALQQVGLAALSERSPDSLSGGEQQRLALASVLVMDPAVLILDEPTAMLDPQGSQAVFKIIKETADSGTTVIIVEHHLEWIARYADRVIALGGGAVIQDGRPEEVFTSPLLLQAGIGWLRYTATALQGRAQGLWPAHTRLPVTLDEAAAGFRKAARNMNNVDSNQ